MSDRSSRPNGHSRCCQVVEKDTLCLQEEAPPRPPRSLNYHENAARLVTVDYYRQIEPRLDETRTVETGALYEVQQVQVKTYSNDASPRQYHISKVDFEAHST